VTELTQYEPCDLGLAPATLKVSGNPFDVEFQMTFRGAGGRVITVPGFYDTDLGYVVRFAAPTPGVWRFASVSGEADLDGITGSLNATGCPNPRVHGRLCIDPEHPRHFLFEDGTRYYMMGYEADWLMLIDQDSARTERIEGFLDAIVASGFNLVTVNAYAYHCPGWLTPEQERDPRYITPRHAPWPGGNDRPDYGGFDAVFFRHHDRVMEMMRERGLLAHIMVHVYNKGVNWPDAGSPDDERFWRYFVARYQAFCNVVWDTAKESYNRPPEYIWGRIATLRRHDGYGHLVTVHDANRPPGSESRRPESAYHPRKDWSDALADFKADQIHKDHYRDALRNYLALPRPYVNIEYGYEQGVEDLPTYAVKQDWREVLRRTWLVTMGGAYANYYYSNTAWNLFVPEPEPPGYAVHRLYVDFWLETQWWLLVPDDRPLGSKVVSGIYCRANPGVEYVVMAETGDAFRLHVKGGSGALVSTWVNPFTGDRHQAGVVTNGEHTFRSPWPEAAFAVLHVRRL